MPSSNLLVLGVPARSAHVHASLNAKAPEHRIGLGPVESVGEAAALGALVCLRNLLLGLLEKLDTLPQRFDFLRHSDHLFPYRKLLQQLEKVT